MTRVVREKEKSKSLTTQKGVSRDILFLKRFTWLLRKIVLKVERKKVSGILEFLRTEIMNYHTTVPEKWVMYVIWLVVPKKKTLSIILKPKFPLFSISIREGSDISFQVD